MRRLQSCAWLAALVWMIDHYFGGDGVRVFLIGVAVFAIVAAIYLMAIGVSAVFARQAMAHHNNVLRGIIDFQRADDYGEVARSVATGISGAVRSGTALDARVLQVANLLGSASRTDVLQSRGKPGGWMPGGGIHFIFPSHRLTLRHRSWFVRGG